MAACRYISWFIMCTSACRAFLLLNGGCRWFGRSQPWVPSGSGRKVDSALFCSIFGMKSSGGISHQSTSPAASAAAAVAWSGSQRQTTLSSSTRLPPADPLGVSLRGA